MCDFLVFITKKQLLGSKDVRAGKFKESKDWFFGFFLLPEAVNSLIHLSNASLLHPAEIQPNLHPNSPEIQATSRKCFASGNL